MSACEVPSPGPAGGITQVESEGSPLACTGHKAPVPHREVARGDRLGAQAVEEGDLRAGGYAHCKGRWRQCPGGACPLGIASSHPLCPEPIWLKFPDTLAIVSRLFLQHLL